MNTQTKPSGQEWPKPRFFKGLANNITLSPAAGRAAIAAGVPWLTSLIAALQSQPLIGPLKWQSWELYPFSNQLFVLYCCDAEGNQVYGELLEIFGHSDVPLRLCCIDGRVQLPTE